MELLTEAKVIAGIDWGMESDSSVAVFIKVCRVCSQLLNEENASSHSQEECDFHVVQRIMES